MTINFYIFHKFHFLFLFYFILFASNLSFHFIHLFSYILFPYVPFIINWFSGALELSFKLLNNCSRIGTAFLTWHKIRDLIYTLNNVDRLKSFSTSLCLTSFNHGVWFLIDLCCSQLKWTSLNSDNHLSPFIHSVALYFSCLFVFITILQIWVAIFCNIRK